MNKFKIFFDDVKHIVTKQDLSFSTIDKAISIRRKVSYPVFAIILIFMFFTEVRSVSYFLCFFSFFILCFFATSNWMLNARILKVEAELKQKEYEEEFKELKRERRKHALLGSLFFILSLHYADKV